MTLTEAERATHQRVAVIRAAMRRNDPVWLAHVIQGLEELTPLAPMPEMYEQARKVALAAGQTPPTWEELQVTMKDSSAPSTPPAR